MVTIVQHVAPESFDLQTLELEDPRYWRKIFGNYGDKVKDIEGITTRSASPWNAINDGLSIASYNTLGIGELFGVTGAQKAKLEQEGTTFATDEQSCLKHLDCWKRRVRRLTAGEENDK